MTRLSTLRPPFVKRNIYLSIPGHAGIVNHFVSYQIKEKYEKEMNRNENLSGLHLKFIPGNLK